MIETPWGPGRPARRAARITGVHIRALIVEDEKNLTDLLRGYLERDGFEVHEAFDGETGLEVARRVKPDIVVLDWMIS